jgi:S-disulfanyl-L-cysteine oxidoreductase SoxD
MCSFRSALAAVLLVLVAVAANAQSGAFPAYPGIGRAATPKEVAAWDIDVRPDFKGLPPGSGSVARGQGIWEAKCASCHGVFGESNEIFTPLVGGTTKDDVKTGRVARLTDPSFPGRTTLMKVATVSTLWDYIHRAMPWNAPKSLSHDEVYAVTAFMLNLGGIVPDDFTLSDRNIRDVQQLMPNRNGMSTAHALWPGRGLPGQTKAPDVRASACMSRCATEPTVASLLPDFARNAHGNLAEQNRTVGAQVGADTTRAAPTAPASTRPRPGATAAAAQGDPTAAAAQTLAKKHNCLACHGIDNRIVGPGLREVARKYAGRSDAAEYLAQKISAGSSGVWGAIAMPAQTLAADDAKAIAQWLAAGAPR